MDIHGLEAWRFAEKYLAKEEEARNRMETLGTSDLVNILANTETNPVVRHAIRFWRNLREPKYGTPEFLAEHSTEYIPTSREDRQARVVLKKRLGYE